ncbi:hypothetical protein M0R19_06425 [Candidatus Pacearchaeota archaeon]|nr:hypothetical protein [Candidatus Pacearchaeota archaeon]
MGDKLRLYLNLWGRIVNNKTPVVLTIPIASLTEKYWRFNSAGSRLNLDK